MGKGKLNIINADTYKTFIPEEKPPYFVKRIVTEVRLEKISHDRRYAEDCENGTEILIDNPEYLNGTRKTIGGIHSPLFGADIGTDVPIYSCDCRKKTGASKVGQICEHCGTEVRSIETDFRITGYIDIAPYHILTFHGMNAMSQVLKDLDELITTSKRIDLKGKIIDDGKYTIMDLYDMYDEVFYPIIKEPKDIIWTSKIPVYNSRLRPHISRARKATVLEVNKHYLAIVNLSKTIPINHRMGSLVQIQRTLNQIQSEFNLVCAHVIEQLSGKPGVFRRLAASGRFDYSSRMVICLGTDLKAYEIDIPYHTMMILYEEEIVNRLSKLDRISTAEALNKFKEAQYTYDNKFANIIREFLKEGNGIWMVINRNPTINEQGILYVKIRKIHDDPTNYCMAVSQDVLAGLGADFDGGATRWQLKRLPIRIYKF